MKNLKTATLLLLLAFTMPILAIPTSNPPVKSKLKKQFVVNELTKHKWTIAEYNEKIKDTLRNITLTMMPCEKAQLLQYELNNTFHISAGAIQCSAEKVTGDGTWEYDEKDNSLTEQYGSGAPIVKEILSLDEGLLKIKYEGEGRKTIIITYLSEVGKQDDSKKDLYVDNSDPVSLIGQMIRENIKENGKYALISLSDFSNTSVKGSSSSQTVVVTPLTDMTDDTKSFDINDKINKLIEQGKKTKLDFVITGELLTVSKVNNSDGTSSTKLKYNIRILNLKKGKEDDKKTFSFPEETKSFIDGKWKKYAEKVIDILPGAFFVGALLGNNSDSLTTVYALTVAAQKAKSINSTTTVFSNSVSDKDRKKQFESSLSIMQALESTQPALNKFIKKL